MDSPAITSATQAVHQELVRKLAEQTRINRLRDQSRRADRRARTQPDAGSWLAPAASRPFAAGFSGGPPVPGGPTGLTGPGGAVTLNPPAPPA